jgi:glutamate 5-kinase
VGRGMVRFSAEQVTLIKGRKSTEIKKLVPEAKHDVIIQRDDLVLMSQYSPVALSRK